MELAKNHNSLLFDKIVYQFHFRWHPADVQIEFLEVTPILILPKKTHHIYNNPCAPLNLIQGEILQKMILGETISRTARASIKIILQLLVCYGLSQQPVDRPYNGNGFLGRRSTTTTEMLSELPLVRAILVSMAAASAHHLSLPLRRQARATSHAVWLLTTSQSPSLARIRHSSPSSLSVTVTSGTADTNGFRYPSPMARDMASTPSTLAPSQNMTRPPADSIRSSSSGLSGLWSEERGTGAPSRQRTARESPQLDTTTRRASTTATTAVDPTWSHLCASHRQLALSSRSRPPAAITSASILEKLRSIAVVQESGEAPAPGSSSATSSCIRSRHASATCEQPCPSNTP
ncbi:hypothetical protein BRADI_4g28097v3 [Brachypodium distachyon]|nr:hypothetical protein BRADI_4g28097v3 [Brachypodium distachyon]